MGEVYSGFAFQALRCVASSIDCKFLGAPTEKTNTAPISDAHKEIQIQCERLASRKDSATAAMLITQLDRVRRAV